MCDVEADEEGIVDVVLDDNTIRAVPRPGTSLRTANAPEAGQGMNCEIIFNFRNIFIRC